MLKAIGARDRDVRRTFLVEAGVLGFLGGVIGTVAGWCIAASVGMVVNGPRYSLWQFRQDGSFPNASRCVSSGV